MQAAIELTLIRQVIGVKMRLDTLTSRGGRIIF